MNYLKLEEMFEGFTDTQLEKMSQSIGAFVYVWHGELPPTCYDMKHIRCELVRRREAKFKAGLISAEEMYARFS